MIYGTVCSGIEAPSVAWEPLGWKPAWFSEIEPFPKAVLAHHYPNVPDLGDMTKVDWDGAPTVDLLIGGTPCQSFSVAGLRKGLADPRGNLALEFLKIVDRKRPRWVVWENVPGVLSSNGGEDFRSFLSGLAGWDIPLPEGGWKNSGHVTPAPGCYGLAWRVLDAQYFGVPQRRRRVFLVASPGNWTRPAAVLFERESLRGNPPPSREKGQGTSAHARGGSHWDGGPHPSLNQSHNAGAIGYSDQELFSQRGGGLVPVAGTMQEVGGNSRPGDTVDGAASGYLTICAFHPRQDPISGEVSPPCETKRPQAIAFDTTQVTSAANRSNPKPGDPCHPLAAGAHAPAVAFADVADPVAANQARTYTREGTGNFRVSNVAIFPESAVRRLTPVECERLQGFPDNYTRIPWRNKEPENCPDGPRYKALGNSMAVPVVRWVGERIEMVEALAVTRRGEGE